MSLGPQVGPFPAGVWAGILAGGVGIAVVLGRRRGSASAGSAPVEPAGDPLSGGLAVNGAAVPSDQLPPGSVDAASLLSVLDAAYRNGYALAGTSVGSTPAATTTTPALTPEAVPSRGTAAYQTTAADYTPAAYDEDRATYLNIARQYAAAGEHAIPYGGVPARFQADVDQVFQGSKP